MNLRLELTNVRDSGRAPARSFEFESGPITVGRSPQCRVVIEGDMISRTHLVFDELHGTWQATHQGSLTPTLLNNAPIPHGQPRRVSDGDVLTIGDYTMRATYGRDTILPDLQPMRESSADMTIGQPNAMTQVASSAQATFVGSAPTMMHGGAAAPGPAGRVVPSLFVLGAEGGKLELREVERPYVIGRAAGCDLMVQNSSVSRRHAIVRFDGNRIYVRDGGARNPLRINGRPIFGESPLSHGDVLGVGPVDLRVATEADAPNRAPAVGVQASANPSWVAAAAADPSPPKHSVDAPSAPVDPPRWDQVAQRGAAPDWSAGAAGAAAAPRTERTPPPAPVPSLPPAPAPSAAPADWSAMAAPAPRAPASPPTWNVPAAPSAPAAPPPPAWDIPAAPAASAPPPAAPTWSPPPPVGAPPPPAVPFAAPPPQAIPESAPPPRAERASSGAALGSAPKVVARRASSHKGWLVAGVICMLVALGSGIVLIVVASTKG
jgi:predicted component of type VI protein secretion system